MFKKYNRCIYCNSANFEISDIQENKINFYVKSIITDLNLKKKNLIKIKTYHCKNCFILQNNPWFEEKVIPQLQRRIKLLTLVTE